MSLPGGQVVAWVGQPNLDLENNNLLSDLLAVTLLPVSAVDSGSQTSPKVVLERRMDPRLLLLVRHAP